MCPDNEDVSSRIPVTVWSIMSKVRLEAMMWGAGTALGELPPYFMARAARLSSLGTKSRKGKSSTQDYDDIENLAEIDALQRKQPDKMVFPIPKQYLIELPIHTFSYF